MERLSMEDKVQVLIARINVLEGETTRLNDRCDYIDERIDDLTREVDLIPRTEIE